MLRQAVLQNGLRVLGEVHPQMASVSFGFFVRTGSRDERPEESGVSHFLEHMCFKGSDEKSADAIKLAFDAIGAQNNAFTGEEHTVYFARVLSEVAKEGFDAVCDLMRPAIRPADFDLEKKVILEEIARYKDIPEAVAGEEADRLFWQGHPAGNSVLGTAESITALTRDQMAAYFARRYAASNMVLAAAGNFDWERFLEQAEARCSGWPDFPAPRPMPPHTAEERVHILHRPDWQRQLVLLLAPGPDRYDARLDALECMVRILGDARNSRLYWGLVEPGLADRAAAGWRGMDGAGYFQVSITCDADRAARALEQAKAVLESFFRQGLSEGEFQAARTRMAVERALSAEGPMGRMMAVGMRGLYGLPYRSPQEAMAAAQALTPQDVLSLGEPFPFAPLTVLLAGPVEKL